MGWSINPSDTLSDQGAIDLRGIEFYSSCNVTTQLIVAASVTANPISIEFPETILRLVSYVILLLVAPVDVVKALNPCPANTLLPSLSELPESCTSGTNSSDPSAHTDIVICFTAETFDGITKLELTELEAKLSMAWKLVVALS